jgi:hypothetical protein
MHTWNMTEYDRIACVDADTLLIQPVHTFFDILVAKTGNEEWLFAVAYDSGRVRWDGQRDPPDPEDKDLNAGVFLLCPSRKQSDYISNLLQNPPPDKDFTAFPEQDFYFGPIQMMDPIRRFDVVFIQYTMVSCAGFRYLHNKL